MALSVDTTPAKHVTVLRNGDGKYEGRKFVVSRRRYRTFDALLSDITHQISAPFGAVRRLYTPKGSRQIRGIDDLEGGATYVAGGSERFKKINYSPQQSPGKNWGFTSNAKPGFLADDPPPLVLPKKNKKYAQRSAQFHKVRQPVQFTVYRNGLVSDKGTRFLLKAREMKSYETVLSIVSFKIRLVEGAVRRLFTLEGSLLHGPEDIADGGQYVACGHRRFIPGPYGESGQPAKTQKLPSIKRRKDLNQASPRTQSNPLPAIQKKATEKKARSEKDSPAPIEEDKGNEDVMVIVSRGSQADLVEDDPVTDTSENGASELLDEQTSSSNGSVARVLAIDSPQGIKTPPPSGHVNYDNDLHDTNNALYEAAEGSGGDPGEITDGKSPEEEYQTDLIPENGETTPRRLTPLEQLSPDNGSRGYTELFDEPSETPYVENDTPNVDPEDEVVLKSDSPVDLDPSNETVVEDEVVADKDDDTVDSENVEDTITRTDAVVADNAEEDVLKTEAVEAGHIEEDISKTEVSTISSKSRIPVAKKSNQSVSPEAESQTDLIPENGETTPRRLTPFEQLSPDNGSRGYTELFDEPSETPYIENDTPNVEPEDEVVLKSETPAPVDPDISDEEFLEEEVKSVPSKSKLDRNPPKKKGNPELLANGTDDSVFNATAAPSKPSNQDGQFLMNNADEAEANGHDDVEEIEEDGGLVEDKPIDLQQAEEIPDDDLNVHRERRSLSSNK